jgi:hypothetical protein
MIGAMIQSANEGAEMSIEPETPATQQSSARFVEVLSKLTAIKKEYVDKNLKWYRDHSRQPAILFRTVGALVIVLSVTVPFLATLDDPWKSVVLPIVSLLIAGLTGLNSFFQWQGKWQKFLQARLSLEYSAQSWELQVLRARYETDEEKAVRILFDATTKLLDDARAVISTETQEYFTAIPALQGEQS